MMKAKVLKIEYGKPFSTQNGEMHSWSVVMDNGDHGNTNTKDKVAPWQAGEEAEYEVVKKEHNGNTYTTLKKVYAQGGGGFKGGKWTPDPEKETRIERTARQLLIIRQSSASTAAELIRSGAGPATVENLLAVADKIEAHILRGIDLKKMAKGPQQEQPAPAAQQPAHPAPVAQPVATSPLGEEDLPF